jgi:hypothetical protein
LLFITMTTDDHKAESEAANGARGNAQAARLTLAERALLALIGEIVAERLWADATGQSTTAGKSAKDDG